MELLREREGMKVYKGNNKVTKLALGTGSELELQNSLRFLKALYKTPYAPDPLKSSHKYIDMEYIDHKEPDKNSAFETNRIRYNGIRLINTLRERGIIHGDLTHPNVLLRELCPVAIDWDEAKYTWEDDRSQKRPESDSYHLYKTLIYYTGDPTRILRRWVAMMPYLEEYYEVGSLLDLGTHKGDFCALAEADGWDTYGVDDESITPCLEVAKELWEDFETEFINKSIPDFLYTTDLSSDIILLFSTWPYIIQDYGLDIAIQVLKSCYEKSEMFFFETQLYGDGPGPEFLRTGRDVVDFLTTHLPKPAISEVVTFPVPGRDAERTVFLVT